MDYDNIPTYTATRVDPDDPEPSGEFLLQIVRYFRPTCEKGYVYNTFSDR